jgi:hypothetical protein
MNWRLPADAMRRLTAALPAGVSGRVLTTADALTLDGFRREVVSRQLPDPDCYRLEAHGPDFPLSHLGQAGPGDAGLILGLMAGDGSLIGYGALTLPPPGEPNRAAVLNLPLTQRDQVADLESAMVRTDWRGRGLHKVLIDWRLSMALALGRRHVVCAVWPGNHQSWGHLLAKGLQGKQLVRVRGGWVRLLTHRDLEAPAPVPDLTTVQRVLINQLASQEGLFDQGYWLWRRVPGEEGLLAELARPCLGEG